MAQPFQLVPQNDSVLTERMPFLEGSFQHIRDILSDMFVFMKNKRGIGLAAPQVGLRMNFFIMDTDGIKRCVVNPIVVYESVSVCTYPEGCLSFPNKHIMISRPSQIIVAYHDENEKFVSETLDGLSARCFQHEYDHLLGRVFTEYEKK